jgi:hypothetical protein
MGLNRYLSLSLGVAMLAGLAGAPVRADLVLSASPGGDTYTSGVPSPGTGTPTGTANWYYNNVRNAATIGIRNGSYDFNANGSLYITTTGGNDKADLEFLGTAVQSGNSPFVATSSLGLLSQLSSFGYSWYRDGLSTNSAVQQISLRLLIDMDGDITGTTGDRRYLVFERTYNGNSIPVNSWQTDDVFNWNGTNSGANLWISGSNPSNIQEKYDITVQEWMAGTDSVHGNLGTSSAVVLGLSTGAGSGWNGTSFGAVDNITLGFGGVSTTYDLAVPAAVPEPGSIVLGLMGLGGLAARHLVRRRRGA